MDSSNPFATSSHEEEKENIEKRTDDFLDDDDDDDVCVGNVSNNCKSENLETEPKCDISTITTATATTNNNNNNNVNNNNNNINNNNDNNNEYKVPPKESRKSVLSKYFFKELPERQKKELVNIDTKGLLPEYEIYLFNTGYPCLCSEINSSSYYFRGEYIYEEDRRKLKEREATNPNCFRKLASVNSHEIYKRLIKDAGINEELLEDTDFKQLVGYATDGDTVGPIDPQHSEQPFAGLVNLGLTCYFNSALQSLFSNVEFRNIIYEFNQNGNNITEKVNDDNNEKDDIIKEEIDMKVEEKDNNNNNNNNDNDDDDDDKDKRKKEKESEEDIKTRTKVILELQKLFCEMEFSISSRISPQNLIDAMELRTGVQQDASEFYEMFTQMVLSVLSKSSPPLKERFEKCLTGKIQYETVCTHCNDVSISKDVTSQIKLPICDNLNFLSANDDDTDDDTYYSISSKPKKKSKQQEDDSLTKLLQKYFAKESIEDRRCDKCGCLCNAERTVRYTYLPDELTIGLLTFGYNIQKDVSEKVIKSIFIPEELSMAEYLSEGCTCESDFAISAVICHIGLAANSGHYIAYVRKYGKWWEFDDTKARMVTELPFKLTDAEGTVLEEFQKKAPVSTGYGYYDYVYDYIRRCYVSRKEVRTEDSVTPFMVFYKKRSVAEAESSACPRALSEGVVRAGLEKRARVDDARARAAEIRQKVDGALGEYRRIMDVVSVPPEAEEYYWVPNDWLIKLKSSMTNFAGDISRDDLKISTKGFLCAHGKLAPEKASAGMMKRVSPEAWKVFVERYGLADGEVELTAESECDECAREVGMRIREDVLNSDLRLKLYQKDFSTWDSELDYYVDSEFYEGTFKNPYYDKTPLPEVVKCNPTKTITCVHGGFREEGSKKISKETWNWIKGHVADEFREQMKEFPIGTKTCELCRELEKGIKETKKQIYDLYPSYYNSTFKSPAQISDIKEGELYYVLKKQWLEAIRSNCSDYSPQPMKEELNMNTLLCKHGNFYEDIEEVFDYYDGTLKLVHEKLWSLISKV